ncbi:MAG: DUF2156 domain-containing protein [Clostridia bacterium]|nr:DUF2156 domain-containing protein [Clostridia bacterium]
MIDFKPINYTDKEIFERYMHDGVERGCELTFSNLYAWGEQEFAEISGNIVIHSRFGEHRFYHYPIGCGDKRVAVDSLIEDARERKIPLLISGVTLSGVKALDELYPGLFEFKYKDSTYDYVYEIDSLATLAGKKFHGKRGHIKKFEEAYPDYKIEEISQNTLPRVKNFVQEWYDKRAKDGLTDYGFEMKAISKALDAFAQLSLDGIMLTVGGKVMGVTFGGLMTPDTFDVQYEKALWDTQGAYPLINREFARYLKNKYPSLVYLDREEDMGILGLRKAKESYQPHHRIIKCMAIYRDTQK